jgi:multidrug efflux pump
MMGGLLVATILTLLFLPALYAAWFRVRRPEVKWEGAVVLRPVPQSTHSRPVAVTSV